MPADHRDCVKVFVGKCPGAAPEAVDYTIGEIAMRLGVPMSISRRADAGPFDLAYGSAEAAASAAVRFDADCYRQAATFAGRGDPALWTSEQAPDDPPDLIGGVFRLLTMLDEAHVQEEARDKRGIFRTGALPPARQQHLATTLVENHVAAIRELVERSRPLPTAVPRWPDGREWAILVTHDTDALRLSAVPELAFNSIKAVLRRDPTRLRMVKDGIRSVGVPVEQDPLYGFLRWRTALGAIGVRSAFYLFVRRKAMPSLNDCRSSVADRRVDWRQLQALADDGCEFGLHPPIGAKDSNEELAAGKRFLEERLERPVHGLRHHYWALDWRAPYRTFRKHVEAGFRYDLSIAWRDKAGFRAGTCLPFRPWDPERRRAIELYTIPTSIMDGHVIDDRDDASATTRALSVLDSIRRAGGVAVMDWHTECAIDDYCYAGHRSRLEDILKRALADEKAWVTTPSELISHWQARRQALCAQQA